MRMVWQCCYNYSGGGGFAHPGQEKTQGELISVFRSLEGYPEEEELG